MASRNDQIGDLLQNLDTVSGVLAERDEDIITLMKDSDVLMRALVARRAAVHPLLVSTSRFSSELTLLVQQSRADLKPALSNLQGVVNLLIKNQSNLDESLRLMAPFYRVFANTLGTGPWFDTWIANLPPVPDLARWWLMKVFGKINPLIAGSSSRRSWRRCWSCSGRARTRSTVTADFPRTVSLYEGSDVKILGVAVGKVDTVEPPGPRSRVKFTYEAKYKVPADAKAAVISPSIVGDRFVQLTPAYTRRRAARDNAKLGVDRTATPLELDEIFGSHQRPQHRARSRRRQQGRRRRRRAADPAARLDRPQLRRPGRRSSTRP